MNHCFLLAALLMLPLPGSTRTARAELFTPERQGLSVTQYTDGSLLLKARADSLATAADMTIFVDHQRQKLVFRNTHGRELPLRPDLLSQSVSQLRSALKVPRDILEAGILVSEGGPLPEGRQGALSSAPTWRQDAFLRLQVEGQGMVRVTGDWLEEQLGSLPSGNPDSWSMYHNGQSVPLYLYGDQDGIFDRTDYLEFWSQPTLPAHTGLGPDSRVDPWTSHEVFFLCAGSGPGIRFAQESGEIVQTDQYQTSLTFPETIHIERDTHFSRLTYVLDEEQPDHVFWTGGIYGGELQSVNFELPGLHSTSSLPVRLKACFRGLSAPAEEGDPDIYQRMRLYINTTGGGALEVGGDGTWKNQQLRIVQFGEEVFPDHQAFLDGQNELFLAGVDESPAGPFSAAMLNWLDVEYQRVFRAEDGFLLFTADPSFSGQVVDFTLKGFDSDDITLYKLGHSRFRNTIIREVGGEFRLRFQDEFQAGTRYLAVSQNARILPSRIDEVSPRDVAQFDGGAAALVIVADSLYRNDATELLAPALDLFRDSFGDARVLSDREVYDRFSHGKTRPHAIRDLIRHAWTSWPQPPEYVLLVGDGALIPRLLEPGHEPVIPLLYEQVYKWGAASSDDWFLRLDNTAELPVYLSRWPAATPEELQNLSQKVLSYSGANPAAWMNSMLLVSGASARDESVFQNLTENMIRFSLPDRFFLRRIEAGSTATRYEGGREQLLDFVDQGQLLVNYAGHGGGAIWEDNGLFQSSDVIALDNADKLAFFTNATCFIGSLDYDGALGRALLNSGPMGAIGVLGSTGLGFRDTGMELITLFYEYLAHNPELVVGRALRYAKQDLELRHGDSGDLRELYMHAVNTMTVILGLPWQRLHLPTEAVSPSVDPAMVRAGEPLTLRGSGAQPGAAGLLELYSSSEHPVQESDDYVHDVQSHAFTVDGNGDWELSISTPDHSYPGGSYLSTRVWTGGDTASSGLSWVYYADSLSGDFIWRAGITPDPPRPGAELATTLRVATDNPLDSLHSELRIWTSPQDSLDLLLLMSNDPQDPQLWTSANTFGPLPDSSLIRLGFILHRDGVAEGTTASWFDVLQARPLLVPQLESLADPHAGTISVQLMNEGEVGGSTADIWLLQDGDTLQTLSSIISEPGTASRVTIELSNARMDRELRLHTFAEGSSSGLGFLPEAVTLHSQENLFLHDQLVAALESEGAVAIGLWTESSPADLQPDLQLHSPAWMVDWLEGSGQSLIGRVLLPEVQADAQVFSLHRESGLALPLVAGNWSPGAEQEIVFNINAGDGLVVGSISDLVAPLMDLEVEGQVFADGGFVPDYAAFNWRITDRNGVDPRPASIELELDGHPVDEEGYSLLQDQDPTVLALRFPAGDALDDPEGLHQVLLRCRDAAGNTSEGLWHFRIGDQLGLDYIGNYPNPFQRETRFIFSLTGVADHVRIEIFTVAGRKVRTLEVDGPLINYVELPWDGRDRAGDLVANGVYFYRFTANGAAGDLEAQGKLARLK